MRLLGELEIVRAGQRIALPASKRTRALFSYLVATAKPHLRDRLCELLWPDPDDPRAALRWSLTKLRGLVDTKGVTRIVADRERVAFEAHGATCDLTVARSLIGRDAKSASIDALRAANALFRGELFEGLDLPDCYQFHEWCIGEREVVRTLRSAIIAELVSRLSASDDGLEEALKLARTRVAIDPLAEASHVAVIRLLTRLGRKREALAQTETCRRILETELGRKPSLELLGARAPLASEGSDTEPSATSAAHARQASESPPPSSPAWVQALPPEPARVAPSPSTPIEGELPLVGRAPEQALIADAIARASAHGPTRVLLFAGEPGIGKTRLLEDLAQRARALGGLALSGRAYEAELARPYGAWIDALRTAPIKETVTDPALRTELATLLPELGAPPEGADKTRLFDAVLRVLAQIAKRGSLLVVAIDDVHWLDPASAALLHFVARSAEGIPLVLACGARPEELRDNDASERLFKTFSREGRLRRVDLSSLDGDALRMLTSAIDPAADVGLVEKESAGNPLFAIEVARALARGAGAGSESLSALIADRLDRVSESARELLPWAAAIGHDFDPDLLGRVTAMPTSTLLGAVDELEERRILRATPSAGYDFVHDLVRAAAYRRLSEPRKRFVHLQIARTLRDADPSGAFANDTAHHAALGGDHELAVRSYLAAAERCLRLVLYDEAASLAQTGIQHTVPLAPALRLDLHLAFLRVYVQSNRWGGRAAELKLEIKRVLDHAEHAGLDEGRVAAGHFLLSRIAHDQDDAASAHEASKKAAHVVKGADPAVRVQQLADTARCFLLIERDVASAIDLLDEAEALAASAKVMNDVDLDWAWGLLRAYSGDYAEARARFASALRAARAQEDHWIECKCALDLSMLDLEEGRLEPALAQCIEIAPVVRKMGDGTEGPAQGILEALARSALGQPKGDEEVDRAIVRLRDVDAKALLARTLNLSASQLIARGDHARARAHAEEALAAATTIARASQIVIAESLLSELALLRGDRAEAAKRANSVERYLVTPLLVSARATAVAARMRARLDSNGGEHADFHAHRPSSDP